MLRYSFYRNVRARDLLDAFLISAISSVLLVRLYLHITGYPQLGGGQLHIAHMLYGGILMMIALVTSLLFLGVRAKQVSAVAGGIGFGIFIDELGKFITEDNDYFFRPTIGLIYATFVILYLTFNFLTRAQRLTAKEYEINALSELEEAVARDMDRIEKNRILNFTDAGRSKSEFSRKLNKFVESLDIQPVEKPGVMARMGRKIDITYKNFWKLRSSNTLVGVLFIAQVLILAGGILFTLFSNAGDISALLDRKASYAEELIVGQLISSFVAGGFFIFGLLKLRDTRLEAFEYFRRATLVNIYLTQFFIFVRLQFDALPGLALNLSLLILISFVLAQEARLGRRYAHHR